jgi:hypothetical protein
MAKMVTSITNCHYSAYNRTVVRLLQKGLNTALPIFGCGRRLPQED